jgi:hypothetical protein
VKVPELSPADLAEADQLYAEGRPDLLEMVSFARGVVAENGPAVATVYLAARLCDWEPDAVRGAFAAALVELARSRP